MLGLLQLVVQKVNPRQRVVPLVRMLLLHDAQDLIHLVRSVKKLLEEPKSIPHPPALQQSMQLVQRHLRLACQVHAARVVNVHVRRLHRAVPLAVVHQHTNPSLSDSVNNAVRVGVWCLHSAPRAHLAVRHVRPGTRENSLAPTRLVEQRFAELVCPREIICLHRLVQLNVLCFPCV